MESLRLLLVSFEFPPYPLAGTGMYTLNLVNNLKNHEVTLITPNHKGEIKEPINKNLILKKVDLSYKEAKVNRSFIDKKTLFSLKAKKLIKTLNLKDYDIMHSITLRDGAFLDYNYMNKYLKTIISVNDYYIIGSSWNPLSFEMTTDFPLRYFHHNIMKHFYFKALRNCNRIIPNTNYVGNIIEKKANIDPSKIKVVNRGINLSRFEVEPDKNKYNSHNVLFIGPNAERKGAIYVVKAAKEILNKFPNSTFTIIGSCSYFYKNKIKSFIKENNIENKFEFIPHLPQQELTKFYKRANAFVMPSIMEAFGQVYLEAMSAKTPVIGTNVGGVSDIITKDVGYLVPPRNSNEIAEDIIEIFSDSKKAKLLGENGRKRVKEKFSIERMVKETVDVYKSVLN
ncbi:glycosyltransferase family 4 protein [Candidatus Woesearchaeota archaeon]|nr:hypothetical protein [uncultured archaeon]MBS3165690.1 glycosyltransferase family 4 protein [Candidatus Woesearchaeota archaeon]HLC86645.1 glycosyltransferase family 4 protein [Candidatus Nanoarchaeia archaeon]